MTSRYILLVDDEPQIHRFLRPTLHANGFRTHSSLTGCEALDKFAQDPPELVILDLNLPDTSGSEILAAIRGSSTIPVIVLSARDNEAEKIALLNAGADDYVIKPFAVGELIARIHTALRHAVTATGATAIFEAGRLRVDTLAHRVLLNGELVRLTPREYDLLLLLARHPGRLHTQQHILREVWGPDHVDHPEYLRVFVSRLRQKIEEDPSDPKILITEAGIGYRLAVATMNETGVRQQRGQGIGV